MSEEADAKILNEVQERFDVNITELPDEIDLSSYSKSIIIYHYFYCIFFHFYSGRRSNATVLWIFLEKHHLL